jgi:hypothetical protein
MLRMDDDHLPDGQALPRQRKARQIVHGTAILRVASRKLAGLIARLRFASVYSLLGPGRRRTGVQR